MEFDGVSRSDCDVGFRVYNMRGNDNRDLCFFETLIARFEHMPDHGDIHEVRNALILDGLVIANESAQDHGLAVLNDHG